jgi:prolipoprotein diacylglyceryltransferase
MFLFSGYSGKEKKKKDLVSTLVNAVSFMFLGGRTGYFITLACRSEHTRYTYSSKSIMKGIHFIM